MKSESCLFVKCSIAVSSMGGESVFSFFWEAFLLFVSHWSWWLFDIWKSFGIRIDFSHSRIGILADYIPSTLILKIDGLIGSWAWSISIRWFFVDDVNSFRSHRVCLIHTCLYLIFVLYKKVSTLPGPGFFCICGMRYDLSGDFSRAQPKLWPFLISSNSDFILYFVAGGLTVSVFVKSDFCP